MRDRERSLKEQAEVRKGGASTRLDTKAAREEKKIVEREAAGAASITEG